MINLNLVLAFVAGMFLTNSLPHIVSGVIGEIHMTPFGKKSSPIVNVVWGYVNLVLGVWVLQASGGTLNDLITFNSFAISFWIGSLVIALSCAWLFGNPDARLPWFKK